MAKNDQIIRMKALEWWRNLPILKRSELTNEYFEGRRQLSLTGREIETIWDSVNIKTEL